MRRLPPQQCAAHLAHLIDLVPSLTEDLLSAVDQPLKVARDRETGKEYLLCDYNRDGDSYRYVGEVQTFAFPLVRESLHNLTFFHLTKSLLPSDPD
jgi:hypothetical protein